MATFCVSGAAIYKAGSGVNSTLIDGSLSVGTTFVVDHWIEQAESTINAMSRYNWTDEYASLDDDVKKILEDVASDLAAINLITYDMSGYSSVIEAEDIINVRRDNALRGLSILRDKKAQRFVKDPTTQTL